MRLVALLGCMVLAGCGRNMVQQPRYDEYERGALFPDHMAMQLPPDGVVARDALERVAATRRPPMTLDLVERGKQRFEIFCVPCHGHDGSGDGIVPARGFPHPPDLRARRLVEAPDRHFYQVITQGYGAMYSYSDRVPPHDRWAIAGYVRALQGTGLAPEAVATDMQGVDHAHR